MAGFGILALAGLVQILLQPDGAETWFILALILVTVSSAAFAVAIWNVH
jgi:hypothetical protein